MSDGEQTLSVPVLLAALRASHGRLVEALAPLDDEEVAGPSYADEWSIGQVAAHLGSGAQIFNLFLAAGAEHTPPPGGEAMQPIWDTWNAKPAAKQAQDAIVADAAFLDSVEMLADDVRKQWRLDMFGTEQSLAGLLQMRLAEHAVHTWDIAVSLDPGARIADDAVALIVDTLPRLVERAGRPAAEPVAVGVHLTGPDRRLRLDLTADGASVGGENTGSTPSAVLTLPAEAWVRLVYGRLDADHTPPTVTTQGVDLDGLRRCFPGV